MKMGMVCNFMGEDVFCWFKNTCKCEITWEKFYELLNERWGFSPEYYLQIIQNQRQTQQQSVRQFSDNFLRLVNLCKNLTMKQQVDYYIYGLLPEISDILLSMSFKSLREACQAAQHVESHLRQRKFVGQEYYIVQDCQGPLLEDHINHKSGQPTYNFNCYTHVENKLDQLANNLQDAKVALTQLDEIYVMNINQWISNTLVAIIWKKTKIIKVVTMIFQTIILTVSMHNNIKNNRLVNRYKLPIIYIIMLMLFLNPMPINRVLEISKKYKMLFVQVFEQDTKITPLTQQQYFSDNQDKQITNVVQQQSRLLAPQNISDIPNQDSSMSQATFERVADESNFEKFACVFMFQSLDNEKESLEYITGRFNYTNSIQLLKLSDYLMVSGDETIVFD